MLSLFSKYLSAFTSTKSSSAIVECLAGNNMSQSGLSPKKLGLKCKDVAVASVVGLARLILFVTHRDSVAASQVFSVGSIPNTRTSGGSWSDIRSNFSPEHWMKN